MTDDEVMSTASQSAGSQGQRQTADQSHTNCARRKGLSVVCLEVEVPPAIEDLFAWGKVNQPSCERDAIFKPQKGLERNGNKINLFSTKT